MPLRPLTTIPPFSPPPSTLARQVLLKNITAPAGNCKWSQLQRVLTQTFDIMHFNFGPKKTNIDCGGTVPMQTHMLNQNSFCFFDNTIFCLCSFLCSFTESCPQYGIHASKFRIMLKDLHAFALKPCKFIAEAKGKSHEIRGPIAKLVNFVRKRLNLEEDLRGNI